MNNINIDRFFNSKRNPSLSSENQYHLFKQYFINLKNINFYNYEQNIKQINLYLKTF